MSESWIDKAERLATKTTQNKSVFDCQVTDYNFTKFGLQTEELFLSAKKNISNMVKESSDFTEILRTMADLSQKIDHVASRKLAQYLVDVEDKISPLASVQKLFADVKSLNTERIYTKEIIIKHVTYSVGGGRGGCFSLQIDKNGSLDSYIHALWPPISDLNQNVFPISRMPVPAQFQFHDILRWLCSGQTQRCVSWNGFTMNYMQP